MDLKEIKNLKLVNSIQILNTEKLCWKLFELTGEIRYYNLCKSLENFNEKQTQMNDEREQI